MALVNVLTAFSDSGGVGKLGLVDASRRLVITGDAAAVAVPVSAASLPLPTGAATETTLAAAAASLAIIDDWDESDRAKVNPIAGQAGVQGGSGIVTALTQRVVLATDISLPAGTNNIGDVDIASLPNEGQQTMAGSISVAIASDQTAVPISAASLPLPTGAATETTLAAAAASLAVLDDWDETDRAKVNIIVGQAGVAAGSGVVGVNTQRVVLATDVALPAGTNNIGDVDIASLPNEGQQTMAGSISVAIASDQTAIPISAASLPLPTGAATETTLAAAAASLAILDDWDESDRAKVNPIAGQAGVQGGSGTVTALTQRVVLATDVGLPAGANNIGDVDVLTLPSLPAGTNNIGDVDIVSLPNEGQQTMANSISVAVASDQSPLDVRPKEDTGTTPTNINATYNATQTQTSADITKQTGTQTLLIQLTLAIANTPGDIEFFIEGKDGSNYFEMKTGILAKWIYDDTYIGGGGKSIIVEVPAPPQSTFRMRAVSSGTDATNTITVSNCKIFQRT